MVPTSASQVPSPRPRRSTEELAAELAERLREQYCLNLSSPYAIIVEGQTDRDYLLRAAQLVRERTDQDWLSASVAGSLDPQPIEVLTPGTPGYPERGGVRRMIPLAKELRPFFFTLEMFSGLVFVFDFDEAGEDGEKSLVELGYRKDFHTLTLHHKEHPTACFKKKGTCIEDLLSLRIQQQFFERGGAFCRVHFEGGQSVRFAWEQPSKDGLRDFVCACGGLEDMLEVVRLLYRVRVAWGLPTDRSVFGEH